MWRKRGRGEEIGREERKRRGRIDQERREGSDENRREQNINIEEI